jgi:ABC-type nitrate/sulfonate/bicarbonate transport system permease component
MISTLVAEMIMGGGGLGGQLLESQRYADSVGLFAGIVEIALLGTVLIRGVAHGRRRLLQWHAEARPATSA